MKRYFWLGMAILTLFEIANVYFIMPLPYSQRVRSIDLAYFLYRWRWVFRVGAVALIGVGLRDRLRARAWQRVAGLAFRDRGGRHRLCDECRDVGGPYLPGPRSPEHAARRPQHRRTRSARRWPRDRRKCAGVPCAVHRLSSSGARHHRRQTGDGELLHRVPHGTRLFAGRRWQGRELSARRDGSLQRHVRGRDDAKLVAPSHRQRGRRPPARVRRCRRLPADSRRRQASRARDRDRSRQLLCVRTARFVDPVRRARRLAPIAKQRVRARWSRIIRYPRARIRITRVLA